jgi:hypothetical protein
MRHILSITLLFISFLTSAQKVKQKDVIIRNDNYGLKPATLNVDSLKIVTKENQRTVNRRGLVMAASSSHKRIDQSSILQINGDTLFLATTVFGSGSGDGDAAEVWGYKSNNAGQTWSFVGIIATSTNSSLVPSLYWNATKDTAKVMYLESISGDIVFKQKYTTDFSTWSSASTKYNPGGHFSPASDRVKRLTDGSLVYPIAVWISGPVSGLGNWNVEILRSVNQGETWSNLGVSITGPDSYADEPDAFQVGNELFVTMRTRVGFIYYTKATIGTWSFAASQSVGIPSPSAESSFLYDSTNKIFVCAANRVFKALSNQPDDRYFMDLWAARDFGNWQNVWNVADNDTNRHYLEPTIKLMDDKIIVAYSDGKYFSPDYYHSLYNAIIPLSKILPQRTPGEFNQLNVMAAPDPWQQEGGFAGNSYGFKYGVRKFGDSAYYRMRLNTNVTGSAGIVGFTPQVDIKTFRTDRGLDQSFDRYNTYPEGAYYQYNYLLSGAGSGLSGNQLMVQHTYGSANLWQLYADGRAYASGRIKAGGYTTTQSGSFASVIAGDVYYNLDSNKYFFYNGTAWSSLGGNGGSGGSVTTLYSGDGSLAGNRIVDASTHYLSFTNLPNIRYSNTSSTTMLFGDLSGATDNKWWGMFNENGVLGFRPYTDALSGGTDFLKLDNAAGEVQIGVRFLKMTANSPFLEFVNTGTGGMGLYFPTYAVYAGVPSSSDAIVTGDAAGDYSVRVASGKKLQWSIDGGSTAAMKLSSSLNDGTGVAKMVTTTNGVLGYQTIPSGGGGTTTNSLTFNNSGSGDASGSTFDGGAAKTLSYNSIGAAGTAASNTFSLSQTMGNGLSWKTTAAAGSNNQGQLGSTTNGSNYFGSISLGNDINTNKVTITSPQTTLASSVTSTLPTTTGNLSNSVKVNGSTYTADAAGLVDIGSVMTTANSVQTLTSQFTDAGNTSTTETDLLSYTIGAGQLVNDGDRLEIEGWFLYAANSNTKTFKFKFGSYVLTVSSGFVTSSGGEVKFKGTIVRTGSGTQRLGMQFLPEFGTQQTIYATSSETLSGSVVLKFTGQSGTASNDIVQKLMTVTYYPITP